MNKIHARQLERQLLLFRRQAEGDGLMLKMSFMGAITERFVLRAATTAEGNDFPPAKVIFIAILIYNLEVSFYFKGAIAVNCNLCSSHAG